MMSEPVWGNPMGCLHCPVATAQNLAARHYKATNNLHYRSYMMSAEKISSHSSGLRLLPKIEIKPGKPEYRRAILIINTHQGVTYIWLLVSGLRFERKVDGMTRVAEWVFCENSNEELNGLFHATLPGDVSEALCTAILGKQDESIPLKYP